ncbi:RING-type E3 ubiquitin transferase [Malassezia vespertilionis]|uniref:RING-type E3 ubiquitin transferase n=1 Tax=Malassezia vespertilionis TaxID=2020962 RepID=A0A2N1J9P6_9BASI|nr:RING-type E3 ubiquitin transferase [Malassezia vespertilionis]PKI83277.1 Hrd1p [Malassezia vespertilionis]WFD07729.1 RING-type E3 ubiquitin transferase [Malassezia vespertilionis]
MARTISVTTLVHPPVLALYSAGSATALGAVLLKAGLEQPDYFSAATWIANSNGCFLILFNFVFSVLLLCGRLMQCILFGQLRRTELEKFTEMLGFQLFDVFLTLTLFPINFNLQYVALACIFKFVELFHLLASIRIEQMGQMQSFTRLFHVRMLALFSWLGAVDVFLAFVMTLLTAQDFGPGSFMIYMTASAFLETIHLGALMCKYACECYEQSQEELWHEKSRYLFYIDLVSDLLMFLTYPACYGLFILFSSSGAPFFLPFSATRNFSLLGFSLYKKVRELLRFRAATRDMENRYPSLTYDELEEMGDRTCIICREEFVIAAPADTESAPLDANSVPKKLGCGHVFHFRCLHSWLERQQSCPTCRRSVLETSAGPSVPQGEATQPQGTPAPGGATEGTSSPAVPPTASSEHHAPHQASAHEEALASPLASLMARFGQPLVNAEPVVRTSPTTPLPLTVHGLLDKLDPSRVSSLPEEVATQAAPQEEPADVRDALRRATLARFANAPAPKPTESAPQDPLLIPLFDPVSVPDFYEKAQQLPDALADWVPLAQIPHSASFEAGEIDTQLRERLRLLQDTQSVLNDSISKLHTALAASAAEKGKEKAHDA